MSTAPSTQPAARIFAVQSFPELDLWNWPLIDGGWRAAPIVVGTAAVAAFAWQMADSLAMGLLTAVVLMLAMWRFWLPVRYHVRGRGIIENCLGRQRLIPWRAIAQCRLRKRGVVLLFRNQDLLFDGFGAKYIDGRDQRDRLIEVINFYQQPDPTASPRSDRAP